jgi:hypothetical protein
MVHHDGSLVFNISNSFFSSYPYIGIYLWVLFLILSGPPLISLLGQGHKKERKKNILERVNKKNKNKKKLRVLVSCSTRICVEKIEIAGLNWQIGKGDVFL